MIENKERAELAEQLAEVEREIYSLKSSLKGVESHFHNFTKVTFNRFKKEVTDLKRFAQQNGRWVSLHCNNR